jgi:hypothetical protein
MNGGWREEEWLLFNGGWRDEEWLLFNWRQRRLLRASEGGATNGTK